MSDGVNKVILIGNVGKPVETRTMDNGTKVANFSMATSESWKDQSGQKQSKTTWHNVVLWRGLAEVAEKYLNKGDSVYIEGKIENQEWEKDGVKRYSINIVGDKMNMLGGNKSDSSIQGATESKQEPVGAEKDDLPF